MPVTPMTPLNATAPLLHRLVSTAFDTPLGQMIAVANDEGLCLLEFHDRPALPRERADLRRLFGAEVEEGTHAHLDTVRRELDEYFEGRRTRFETPLSIRGTPWERGVWDQLLAIPCGETRCYEDIAIALGMPGAPRAVGLANGRNRIAILIPCHRVIEKSGKLRGYGGGLWRKARLLEIERNATGKTLFA